MPKAIIMPRFGMTQEEATIVQWIAQPGQRVEKGDPICEVTTDKINMEVESTASGTLTEIQYPEGAVVPVTKVIAYVIEEDEQIPSKAALSGPAQSTEKTNSPETRKPTDAASQPQVSVTPVAQRMAATEGVDLAALEGSGPAGKITRQDVRRFLESQVKPEVAQVHPGKVRATPAARRLAAEHQVDLELVKGTGFQGRIQGPDLQAYLERQKTAAKPTFEQFPESQPPVQQVFETGRAPTIIPLDRMRLTIGQRMQASVQEIPHILLSMDIDMTRAVSMRATLNTRIPAGQPQISMTAVLVKACAAALHEHPDLNSYLLGAQLHVYPDANIGVAVALEGGLIVPVIHQAGEKSLFQVGAEIADLSRRARDGKLKPEDVDGGTFTLSNLGMFGIDHFTAIINPPQVAILATGQISRRFIPDEGGKPVVRSMMTATLSVDHRVIDGVGGARFLNTLRNILETAGSQWG